MGARNAQIDKPLFFFFFFIRSPSYKLLFFLLPSSSQIGGSGGYKNNPLFWLFLLFHFYLTFADDEQAMCWPNTLDRCRRIKAANIASSSWPTSSRTDQSSTRGDCRTQSPAIGHRGPVSAHENSPNYTGSASQQPLTISRQSSTHPFLWPSNSASWGGRVSSTSSNVF